MQKPGGGESPECGERNGVQREIFRSYREARRYECRHDDMTNRFTLSVMEKLSQQRVWQGAACLACLGVLWIRLDAFGASEFSGGRITGKLFTMADLGSLLFLVTLLLTAFFPRVAAAIALAATPFCMPFYLYILMPEPYRQVFKGENSVPLQRPFIWNNWAIVGILSLVIAAFVNLRTLSKGRARLVR